MGDRIKVIMDCDPGIDDGIALAYAAAHQDELELLAITTFAGNATIDKVTKNALELADFYGLKVPVAKGQERPLVKEPLHAEEFHGETGLGHCVLPETKKELASDNAVLFIRDILNDLPEGEQVTVIETAPMTNLALLLRIFPEVKEIQYLCRSGSSEDRIFFRNSTGDVRTGCYPEMQSHQKPDYEIMPVR